MVSILESNNRVKAVDNPDHVCLEETWNVREILLHRFAQMLKESDSTNKKRSRKGAKKIEICGES